MNNDLKQKALAVRNTPWQPMAGMPTNVLNAGGVRVARCDFDGDFAHSDAHANAAYIVAASPDVVLGLMDALEALQAELGAYPEIQAMLMKENKELRAELDDVKQVQFPKRINQVTEAIIAERDQLRTRLTALEDRLYTVYAALGDALFELKVGNVYTTATDSYRSNNELIHHLDTVMNGQYVSRALAAGAAPQQPSDPAKGFVLVPLRPTRAMEDVFQQDGWEWADVLAAAEVVTEDQYLVALESDVPPPAEPASNTRPRHLCTLCTPDGKCMHRSKLCTIMLDSNSKPYEFKRPDETEGGTHD